MVMVSNIFLWFSTFAGFFTFCQGRYDGHLSVELLSPVVRPAVIEKGGGVVVVSTPSRA